jgi:hypothetical protein
VIGLIRRLALPIAIVSLVVNLIILIISGVLWWMAIARGWLDSVVFVSNVSMLALVFAGVSGDNPIPWRAAARPDPDRSAHARTETAHRNGRRRRHPHPDRRW